MNKLSSLAIFFVAFLFLTSVNSHGLNAPLILGDEQARYDLSSNDQAYGFFAVSEPLDAAALISLIEEYDEGVNTGNLIRLNQPIFLKSNRYALYVNIKNETGASEWMLHSNRFLLDKMEVYSFAEQEQSYAAYDFTDRSDAYRISVLGRGIPLAIEPQKTTSLLVIFEANTNIPPMHVGLITEAEYFSWISQANSVFNLMIGGVFGLIIIGFVGYFVLRDPTFFWFGLSSVLLTCVTLLRSHYGINFISGSGGFPVWIFLFVGVMELSHLIFAGYFLSIRKESKWLILAFKYCALSIFIYMGASFFVSTEVSNKLAIVSALFLILLTLYACIMKTIREGKYYILFLLGWMPFLFMVMESAILRTVFRDYIDTSFVYKLVYEPAYQALHILIHLVAVILRVIELKQTQRIAAARDHAKTSFLAYMSHDLRQPLYAMGLLFKQLENEISTASSKVLLTKVNSVHDSMSRTFGALMDWSQLEAGKIVIDIRRVQLGDIFSEIQTEYEYAAKRRNLDFRVRECSVFVETDAILLKRILGNLVSNAIKYTDSGGLLLGARRRLDHLVIDLWDTGIGISQNQKDVIFDLYEQITSIEEQGGADNRSETGLGIGLANVKSLAEAMGYVISVHSVPDKGSVFRVEIPFSDEKHTENELKLFFVNFTKNKHLHEKLDENLRAWGYQVLDPWDDLARIEGRVVILADNLTESSVEIMALFKNVALVSTDDNRATFFLGLFGDLMTGDVIESGFVQAHHTHRLKASCNLAELRAFVRFIESV